MEFKHKEIIEVDSFYLETPENERFNELKKQSTYQEHLDNYYNWFCLMIGMYNQYHSHDHQVYISDLSDVYEHKNIDEVFWFRSSFFLTFTYDVCAYENPKWYRNGFLDELNVIWRSDRVDEYDYIKPPGVWLELSSVGKAFSPFVHHVNHEHI